MAEWENKELVTEETRGFVYLIVNTVDKKFYLGKKKTVSERRVAVPGRKNKKLVVTPSDWQKYWGSCAPLLEDKKRLGEGSFRRIILGTYRNLHTVNYAEAEMQFLERVLDETGNWYNGNILTKVMRPPEDRQYLKRLARVMKEFR